jgi:hypothetical protein
MDSRDEEEVLIKLLLSFANRPPGDCGAEDAALKNYVHNLALTKGWRRGQIYKFLVEIANHYRHQLPAESFDELDNYITSVTGDCCPDFFARFPGEPEDPREFVAYVREHKWMVEQ